MPIISGGATGGIGAVTVTGTASSGQVPVASSSTAGAWALPPGYEFGYDQITGTVTVASTTEGTPTTIITCAAHTFDGGAVLVTFFAGRVSGPGSGQDVILLLETGTSLGRLGWYPASVNQGVTFQFRFTPTAGSHSYVVAGFGTATNNGSIIAGAGGATTEVPCFVRFTKV